ncbi:glycosyltransferase family 4 protein [Faecalibaculum rodentium]|uniref:glycosyltransferase family 4 protein n=1 Tax=Faecalibaculum rodentium TaxID=1702221 RepID=UPI001F55B578|nr:glycosyltransferase family 4 protein [Faecalibaculum rodentium]
MQKRKDINQEIYYICNWGNDKRKAWSGTTFSLYTALSRIREIHEYSITYNIFEKWIMKLAKICIDRSGIHKTNTFNSLTDRINQNKLKMIPGKPINLQIGCYGKFPNSYIYEDLSASALLYTLENNPKSFFASNFGTCSKKSLIKKALRQNVVYENALGILTMSHWVKEILIQSLKTNKVYYVGAGINVDISLISDNDRNCNRILFIGRDFKRKGGYLVLDAYKDLVKRRPSLELYIAGPKKLEDIQGVHWLGDVNSDDLPNYLNLCDVFCMPSEFEAYGLVYAEAMCFGLPCIGSDLCEGPYLINDGVNGYILKDRTPQALSILLERALDNEQIKLHLRECRQEYIDKYSWDTVAKRIITIINEDKLLSETTIG